MEQDSVDLSAESLNEAIEKIRIMRDVGVLEASPSIVLGSVSQAATLTNISSGSSRDGGLRVHGRPVEIKPFEVYLDMEMLNDKSSAYNVDPETLANLWVVRFGKDWVDAENIGAEDKEDIWWRHAANRLRELGYLEMHTLASSYRVVLRIVE